jgi:uncharacterized protein
MPIPKSIELNEISLYFPRQGILAISDIHLGLEEIIIKQGMMIPKNQFRDASLKIEKLLKKLRPKKVILCGDIKHEFGTISKSEWKETLDMIDLITKYSKLILIKGNHDAILGPIARKKNVEIVEKFIEENLLFVHGDKLINIPKKIQTIIIGHEHPAITLEHEGRVEKYKCFLFGKYKRKDLIVIPSFNFVTEGTNILEEQLLSPFLKKIDDFEVYISGDKIYDFGKVKDIRKKFND